jgi:hypothetical protein
VAWTSPADLRAQVQKLWDKGRLLAACVGAQDTVFPLRLKLAAPGSGELATRFAEVRLWAADLRQHAVHYRLEEREVRHREIGNQTVPAAAWLDSLEAGLALIGKSKEAQRFSTLLAMTRQSQPALLPWLADRPLTALALAEQWSRLLAVVSWMQSHPRPGIYLRQVDLPGVDSKFIEAHRAVLAELFELALPSDAIDLTSTGYSGLSQFCQRYGFLDKPLRIRFRLLDAALTLVPGQAFPDIALTQIAFAKLDLPVRRVFITENEINFLAFPPVAHSLVIFGSGYGFEVLADVAWLQQCEVFYWGDIDTHGFAILDQLRVRVPQARSFLMDQSTLLAHEAQWGQEPQPELRDLSRLTQDERAVYDTLRDNRIRPGLRLEQERVGFGWLQQALASGFGLIQSPHTGVPADLDVASLRREAP